ncbi:PIG-L family deacetylase [Longimicrobium terrae]|uniref:LmbE family N-acetylglucosaminyl deacetylase n=1 Tax=Longimicrobium terrae TaxID=1639882 RepID=A0A841H145_9BACT|nr:PIG-L family deacetylase [Longimicrobium terrae]MBB4637278.1 LmbE family N-acetylglucosaminyl deacetylase [Longimicrobium terrae]MBB6071676.1 LmbE family N-acetylglucosaminyl deacetylase [Longimicrobium terrae]NNC28437.1 PIG-L family deacetylase [Longimicrobium terrae]
MTRTRLFLALLAAAALAPALPSPAPAQAGATEYRGAAALGLSLRRVGVAKRVLMVGAHPDDEDTQLLARLALEEGADVAYLSLTRGEGGQNGIGTELGEGLGLLRTEELLAARRVDGAEQFFSRAFDFGFSKSADEAFRHWPREELVRDVTRVIRTYRPDVVITVFSGTPRDGHGQHQVSAIVARDAYDAASDPARFPEQIAAGLRPFAPRKLYQSLRSRGDGATLQLAVGDLDPLIGRSPFQQAMASRSRHRSQDMGAPEVAGPRASYLLRVRPAQAGIEATLWTEIDTVLATAGEGAAARGLVRYQAQAEALRARGNPLAPAALAADLASALTTLNAARAALPATNGTADLAFRMDEERRDVERALALASGLVVDATASRSRLAPGDTLTVELSLWNGGAQPVTVAAFAPELPAGWTAEAVQPAADAQVAPGALMTRRFRVRVPADAELTIPYFLRQPRDGDMYRWPDRDAALTRPFEAAPVRAVARLRVAGAEIAIPQDATFREVDPRQGELRRPVMVVPAVSVLLSPRTRVLSTAAPRPLSYTVRLAAQAAGGARGTLRLNVPAGWRAEPASVPVQFAAPGEVREVRFTVTPPASARAGDVDVSAVFEAQDGRRFTRGVQMIDYPHVRARPLYHAAESRVRAFDLRVPAGLRVAYIEGAGEEGPAFLENFGITPTLLSADDLAEGDLSRFDVIITGSRAYEVRADLGAHNQRLLDWVTAGGTMIVQYNKYEIVEGRFTPEPITMARPHGRVTDENAAVRILRPEDRVFTSLNRIGPADFEGWVQERGLYFAETWDPFYTPLLEMGDPGESLQGGLLVGHLGKGTYVYTGLAFFRQFPEGVPGAYRLFANLLALGARDPAGR